jgi:hypothetical protein
LVDAEAMEKTSNLDTVNSFMKTKSFGMAFWHPGWEHMLLVFKFWFQYFEMLKGLNKNIYVYLYVLTKSFQEKMTFFMSA